MQITVNIVLKIDDSQLLKLEGALRDNFNVVDVKILPDTEKLYRENPHFKQLLKRVKEAKIARDNFINEHNI